MIGSCENPGPGAIIARLEGHMHSFGRAVAHVHDQRMQLLLMRRATQMTPLIKTLIMVSALASCSVGSASLQGVLPPSPAAVVARLYEDFACEAISDRGCPEGRALVDLTRPALASYFDDQLVDLWLADRNCVARTREICNLDFDPVWASQDPVGTSFKVIPTAHPTIVNVELLHAPSGDHKVLHYTVVRTAAGWRIHDIAHGRNWSLRSLLSQPH